MDRLTSMDVFVKAVEHGSFAAAAQTLHLSAPMVGKHIRVLEEHLGVRLLNRTTRSQSLTDVGRAYYERCKRIIAEIGDAEALAADQASEPRGVLRVTMPVHFGRCCAMPVLAGLARRHPLLELELSFGDRFCDLAEDGYDLAIRTGVLEDRAGLVGRRIARQRMTVCASPRYLDAHGTPATLDDLARHAAVVYRRSGPIPHWLFPRADGSVVQALPQAKLRFDDLAAIADAACADTGLAWLPAWLVNDHVRTGDLVEVLTHEPGYLYDAYAIWLQTPHLAPKVRLAIDALASELPRLMG